MFTIPPLEGLCQIKIDLPTPPRGVTYVREVILLELYEGLDTSLPSTRPKGVFTNYLHQRRYLLVIVRDICCVRVFIEICQLMLRGFAFKFEIVLESADNSVRKDKGRYLNERCVVARKVRYRADLARNCC